jgi:hypothetical protein
VVSFSPNAKEDLSNARLYDLVPNYLSRGYAVIYAAESIVYSPRRQLELMEAFSKKELFDVLAL